MNTVLHYNSTSTANAVNAFSSTMPRPKKAGAPQPKKRSRNGCWPCKSRKVKCDEEHPSCLNCQRQGETCDYSIRLNWDGRGKRKAVANGQMVFSSGLKSAVKETTPAILADLKDETASTVSSETAHRSSIDSTDAQPRMATSDTLLQPYQSQPTSIPTPYPSQPSPSTSMIDPNLMGSESPSAGVYLPTPYQTQSPPDVNYAQSYERFTSNPPMIRRAGQQPLPAVKVRKTLRRHPVEGSTSDIFRNKTTSFPSLTDDIQDEGRGRNGQVTPPDRPSKRFRYDNMDRRDSAIGPKDMPPPNLGPCSYGYGAYSLNQPSPAPFAPMTPGTSSNHSDEGYKSHSSKVAPLMTHSSPDIRRLSQDTSEPRRLSVESLLSGPPGMPDPPSRQYSMVTSDPHTPLPSSLGSGESFEEMKTWGVDRGCKDRDYGKNDDANAISGGSPVIRRDSLELSVDVDDVPVEFGFGAQAKDTAFEKNDYYAKPVMIKLPRSFDLPPMLTDNPMNILYFHHFISHTARLLVPHHCSSNPFQKILPQMAIQDQNLMNLLLAYSASHRARLLQQEEPATRIAFWVKDVFRNLLDALNNPYMIITNGNLAAAIMLASLEIISPKAFGISVPWQQHLQMARSMIIARGGIRTMYKENSEVSRFLLLWFAYLDVLGCLIDGPADPSPSTTTEASKFGEGPRGGWLSEYNFDDHDDYRIECLFGFTGRCITILANIAELARKCDNERIDSDKNIRPKWEPSEEVVSRAEKLMSDLEAARTNTRVQACPHLRSAGEAAYQWDTREMAATNEAYHWAGLVHLHRRILGKSSNHEDVKSAVGEIIGALFKVRKRSSAEACLLFPIFTAGCDAQNELQKTAIVERFKGIEEYGMSHVQRARSLMERVWQTGKPWETLVSGEFIG